MTTTGIGVGVVGLSMGAFAGAFAAFFFVALLSNAMRAGPDRTILAGVAASQLFNAVTAYIVTTAANAQQARDVMFWLLGSFGGVRWPEFILLSVVITMGLLGCLAYSRVLDAFAFGDEAAAALGVNVGAARMVLFALTALMTATIVSMVGSIGFVGLVVPHAMRYVVRIAFAIDHDSNITSTMARPEMILRKVLEEHLKNAQDASSNEPKPEIRAEIYFDAKDQEWHFVISDNGAGFAKEEQENAFEAFFTTKKQGFGSGLGLYISYYLLSQVGGRIVIEEHSGHGARMRVTLPKLEGLDDQDPPGA